MPVMDGFEVLAKLRADPLFQELPICIYSSSSQPEDIERAVRLGADSHIEKPLAFSAQVEFARSIAQTWFGQPAPQHGRPRVLLRKRRHACHGSQAGYYLQPNGHWSENRETARRFAHTVDAHWWAEEQECLGAEIILAYPDPETDYTCMKT